MDGVSIMGTSQEVFSLVEVGLIGSDWNGLGCFPFVSDEWGKYQGKSLEKAWVTYPSDCAEDLDWFGLVSRLHTPF